MSANRHAAMNFAASKIPGAIQDRDRRREQRVSRGGVLDGRDQVVAGGVFEQNWYITLFAQLTRGLSTRRQQKCQPEAPVRFGR
jgi:hypothetical protein